MVPTTVTTRLGIEAWLRPTPQYPNQIDSRYMTVFPFVKSCAGDPNSSAEGASEGLNPRTLNGFA